MLSREENELLTRVGPGTPMGNLMRRYWMPVLQASELQPGGRVKRVKLLGEELVAFRNPHGEVGLVGEFCPHRRASLYFGRNEVEGIRCPYHGWQFARDGQCIDMPNEPLESNFQEKVRHLAYPCAERGGVIWTYMGPASPPPPALPDLEWAMVPAEQRFVSKFYQECNYMQALEGGIDPAHISFLHGVLENDNTNLRTLDQAAAGFAQAARLEKAPYLDVVDTDYGVLIGARRDAGEGKYYWRITQYHLPFHTMPPTDTKPDPICHTHVWIPVDDENLVNWCVSWHPTRPLTAEEVEAMRAGLSIHITEYAPSTSEPYGDIRPVANKQNDYLIDWEAHRTRRFLGIPGVGLQDKAVTESQQPVYDRTREWLGRSDIAIIRIRKYLLDAAMALHEHGTPPPAMDAASFLIRPASLLLAKDVHWVEGAKESLVARPMAQSLRG